MNTIVKLNIGLNDNSGQPLNVHTACLAVESYGFSILASRVFESPTGGESVLVLSAQYRGSDLPASIYALAVNLRQDCIAIFHGGRGELIGPAAEKWGEFNPAFFVGLSGETLADDGSPCKLGQLVNDVKKLKLDPSYHHYNAAIDSVLELLARP